MENGIVLREESHQKNDSVVSASKSLGLLVQINSIAIDITSAVEETESPTHEHFSIRGFVARMRKKNRKTCLPFESEGNDAAELVDNLPPLVVPRFQWWQCSNCIPDINTKRCTEETVLIADRSDVGTSSCQNVAEKKDLFLSIKDNIGNNYKLCSRVFVNDEDNYPSKAIRYSKSCGSEGYNATNNVAVRPLCIVDEQENASSGKDGAFSAFPNRRKPKLRFLADIMVEERNLLTSDNPIIRSAEKKAVLDPHLQSDISVDAAEVTRSPQSKRKMVLEEERGSLGVNFYNSVAKKLRSPILHAERKCRRVRNSESESEKDAPMRLDLQLGEKFERIKQKRNKALDFSKKVRRSDAEDRTASVSKALDISKKVRRTDAEDRTASVSKGTNFGKSRDNAPSTVGETGLYFRNSRSGEDEIETMGKMAEAEANLVPLMRTSVTESSILGDCSSKGKVALGLSLNSFMDADINYKNRASFVQFRGIPDLNEEFPQRSAAVQGNRPTNHSEKRNLPLHKPVDAFASYSKETGREGKRQMGVYELQNKDNSMDVGTSDDIPMEIVELLARNQHERALENSRRHISSEGINSFSRGYSGLHTDHRPGMINFPLSSRNCSTVGVRQNINPSNLARFNNNSQMDMSKPEERQFGFFTSSTSRQQQVKSHYSAPGSIVIGPKPSTGGAELLWHPTRENVPFHLIIPPKQPVQTNRMGMHPYSDQCYQGKTIGDHHRKVVIKGKKALHDATVLKEGRMASTSASVRSLDHYSNDTIPAMQLLSLMDQQIVSGPSFEVAPKRIFVDKTFSSSNNHRQLNGKENHNFLGGSFFSRNGGVYCSGESSKKASSYVLGQSPPEMGKSKATPLEGLVIRPARSSLQLGPCTLNRNPADFSIPDARNEFTLTAKDLKFRKRNASKEKLRLLNVEKRGRIRKDDSVKECSRK